MENKSVLEPGSLEFWDFGELLGRSEEREKSYFTIIFY